jgi:hypothetical protein
MTLHQPVHETQSSARASKNVCLVFAKVILVYDTLCKTGTVTRLRKFRHEELYNF